MLLVTSANVIKNGITEKQSQPSLVAITVIIPVGYHQMIEQADVHQLGSTPYSLRQPVVVTAGRGVSRRMVMTKHHRYRTFQQSFTQNTTDIHLCGSQSAMTDTNTVNHLRRLVEQQHPTLLHREVTHQRIKHFVYVFGTSHLPTFQRLFLHPAPANLRSG